MPKVNITDCPGAMPAVLNGSGALPMLLAVWTLEPWLIQVTEPPGRIVTAGGLTPLSLITTLTAAGGGLSAAAGAPGRSSSGRPKRVHKRSFFIADTNNGRARISSPGTLSGCYV